MALAADVFLAGCETAPDERSFQEIRGQFSLNETYNDYLFSQMVAERIVDGCPHQFALNVHAQKRHKVVILEATNNYYDALGLNEGDMVAQFRKDLVGVMKVGPAPTLSDAVNDVLTGQFASTNNESNLVGFLFAGARVLTYTRNHGLDFRPFIGNTCPHGDREIADGKLIGSLLEEI